MKRLILLAALWIATTAGAQEIQKETFAYAVRESDTLRLDRYAALTDAIWCFPWKIREASPVLRIVMWWKLLVMWMKPGFIR